MSRLGAAGHPARVAAAVEFVLEGLHLNRKLNKDRGRRRAPVQGVRSRYSRWDGSQSLPDFDADDLLAAMADDLVADGDLRRALERLLRQGFRNRDGEQVPGLRDLLERLRRQRQSLLDRHDLGDVLGDLRKQLQDVLDTERQGIDRRVESARQAAKDGPPEAEAHRQELERIAAERRAALDALPEDLGGAVRGLQDYQFVDPEAWQKFQELMLRLRQEMTQSLFGQLKQGLQGMGAQGKDGLRQMLGDLNRLLRQQAAGGQPDVQGFMDRWGQMFPGVESLDQLLEQIARQSAQMQSLLESLTPEQRRELEELQQAMLDDPGMQEALDELGEHLDRLGPRPAHAAVPRPGRDAALAPGGAPADGGAPRARPAGSRTSRTPSGRGASTASIPPRCARRSASRRPRRRRRSSGSPRSSRPRATSSSGGASGCSRRRRSARSPSARSPRCWASSGATARAVIASTRAAPAAIRPTRARRTSSATRSCWISARRWAAPIRRQGPGVPVRLEPGDFAVRRTELSTRCATALLLDMSRSMIYRGCWTAAKKVALALHALIRAQYPQDALYVIGFSLYARELDPDEVPTRWSSPTATTARTCSTRSSSRGGCWAATGAGTARCVMITDGEPTAHLEGSEAYFDYPTTRRTWQLTQAEVLRCAREGVTINTFMLEDSPGLVRFVSEMSRINRGRAFFVQPDRLGEYVLVDYLARKQKRVG